MPKRIKRVRDPNKKPLVSTDKIEFKTLNPVQVVDPKLTPEEIKQHKEQMEKHVEKYTRNALQRANQYIEDQFDKMEEDYEKQLEKELIEEENERLARILKERAPLSFRKTLREGKLSDFSDYLKDADMSLSDDESEDSSHIFARKKF